MPEAVVHPVFFDPSKCRWKRFKFLSLTVFGGLALVFAVLVASILVEPGLAPLPLGSSHDHGGLVLATPAPRSDNTPQSAGSGFHSRPTDTRASDPQIVRPEVIGFYVNWDDNSLTSLKQNISRLDRVIAEWLHLSGSDGSIGVNDPSKLAETVLYIRQQRFGSSQQARTSRNRSC